MKSRINNPRESDDLRLTQQSVHENDDAAPVDPQVVENYKPV